MHLCHYLGFGGYQGATVCTLVTQILPCIFLILYIKKNLNFDYKILYKNGLKIVLSTFVMMLCLYLISIIYKVDSITRFGSLVQCIVYALIGVLVYGFMLIKTGVVNELFGNSRILKKFKIVK